MSATLLACGDDTTGVGNSGVPENQSNERISIENNAGTLGNRVTYGELDIPVTSDEHDGEALRAPKETPFELTLVAEVLPPTVDGRRLQATSVTIRGGFAIVGYGMAGPDYLGGVEVLNIGNRRRPRLESQAIFSDSDVFDVSYFDGRVFLAESTSDVTFTNPSAFEVLHLSGHKLVLDQNVRAETGSFVTTSVASTLDRVYSTSGNTGRLSVFDPTTWAEVESVALTEARSVAVGGGRVAVAQGMPGRLVVFDEVTLGPLGTYPFAGADVPESKTTVTLLGGKAFIGAGPGGVQILSVETGSVLGSVPIPDPASLGLDPSVVVTNSVGVDADLIFISNGEAGVYVAEGAEDFSVSGSEDPQDVQVLGRLELGALQSVNHIAFKNDYLIVAAGLGGLKIVEVVR